MALKKTDEDRAGRNS